MENPSIKKNIVLSTAYQILTLVTPFITAPYISRVLEAEGIGVYSYTSSIQTYFSMFATLGTVSYGTREIARNRNDLEKRSVLFWEIELLTVVTTIICLLVWGAWILCNNSYKLYYLILTINLLVVMFDISWFFTGMEQFKYIVGINSIFKIGSIVALFVFVKDTGDIAKYMLIMGLSTLVSTLSMWIYIPKFIEKINLKEICIFPHFKETLVYFVPTIATSVYTILDKTLIGVITKDTAENGYYEQATKIINIAKSITFTALNSVLGARISYLFAEKKYDEIRERIDKSIDYILFMGIGICFGLIGISEAFVPVFFGSGYDKVTVLLRVFSALIVIIGISNCLGSQYYTPAGLRSLSAKFIISGSCVNFVLNLILIPKFGSIGAAVASLIAELTITILYMIFCNNYVTVDMLIRHSVRRIAGGFFMLISMYMVRHMIDNLLIRVVVQFLVGGGTYCLSLIIMKDTLLSNLISVVMKKYKERRK